jgi:tetraacyldisaccharide 4'-kinase
MLKVLGSGFGTLARWRAALYAGGWLPRQRLARPVISVGALSVGGAGKTPTAALLAALLQEAGWRPAILSRGYRRRGVEPLLVSAGDGAGPLVDAAHAGDEPFWLARVLPSVAVAVAARREESARLVLASGAPDLFLLDDGFQHLRVARDVDLLVFNPEAPFWQDAPMPAGRLREAPGAEARAHAFLAIGGSEEDCAQLAQRCGDRPCFQLVRQPAACWPAAQPPPAATATSPSKATASLPGESTFAFAGIARPQRFFEELARHGIELRGRRVFPDHHAYSAADLTAVARDAAAAGAALLLTTEKDAVRLPAAPAGLPIHIWGYRLSARRPDVLLQWLQQQARLAARPDAE